MAAGQLAAPGTEFGPCAGECQHKDCAMTRKDAATICPLCGKEIGYETRMYQDAEHGMVHAHCLETKLGL